MTYRYLMDQKHSVREYQNKKIPQVMQNKLIEHLKQAKRLDERPAVELHILHHSQVFKQLHGYAGYNGIMLSAPHYAILLSEAKGHFIENSGYLAEELCLYAFSQGIDSCLITFANSRRIIEQLHLLTDKEVTAIIAIGYGKKQTAKVINTTQVGGNYSQADIQLVELTKSEKLPISEIVYLDTWGNTASVSDLEERALLAPLLSVQSAPSTLNRQPWRFLVDQEKLILVMKNDTTSTAYEKRMDAGFVMFYFEAVVHELLFPMRWHIGPIENTYQIPLDYIPVAYCIL